jgi:hypothetical protein
MTSENKKWDSLKIEYLHKIEKALSSIKHPRRKDILEDVRSHLDRRFAELEPDQQTRENFQAIITEMGPASDYAELLEPAASQQRRSVPLKYLLGIGLAAVVIVAAAIVLPILISSKHELVTSEEFRRDFAEKIAKLNIDTANLDYVIRIFGEPMEYVWGSQTFNKENLPRQYIAVYPNGFCVYIRGNQLVEVRHEGPGTGYAWRGKLRVGSSLEEALEVVSQPTETVEGQENRFEDGVLYKDIEGRKGHCYYARTDQDVRLWFADYKIAAIYMTRSDYGAGGGKVVEKADIPPTSIIDENGNIVDKIDYPFVNDPEALGTWESVDFVSNIEDFKPGTKHFKGDLFLKELFILENGKTNWACTWTKGLILSPADKTASRYVIEEIVGSTYMFLEWKSGDYIFRHMKPSYYVLKEVPDRPYVESRTEDKIDYPFVDDPDVIGTWKSVDFVKTVEQFSPGRKRWKGGELFLKELVFQPGGKTTYSWRTWTKGLVLSSSSKTASRYILKEMNGSTYMFFEWKSGDYTIRGMKPKYYVLKKV